MHKNTSEILVVLLDPMIQRTDMFLVQEPQHVLLELAASLARDDLQERDPFCDGFVDDIVQAAVNVAPFIKDLMQVQRQFCQCDSPFLRCECSIITCLIYGRGFCCLIIFIIFNSFF